ncbi:MAG TPA: SUMF1/EgtB/PvdO family nonheme iron enzyme, partial [Planctomycetota bacterium]|nr:SUMF1/EgtB/PvdO family nonheme iron enzyme [Planctomycetota bacterium]
APHVEREEYLPRAKSGPWSDAMADGLWPLPRAAYRESPVVGLYFGAITRFLRWKNGRAEGTGWEYLLPTPTQWEKAARGVDARWFPWGDRFDYGLANSLFGRLQPGMGANCLEPRGWFPTDESPFGLRDMAGGAVEFNEGYVRENLRTWTVIRGGSWATSSPVYYRATSRIIPESDVPTRGFRLVATRR